MSDPNREKLWNAWLGVYVALCKRIADHAVGKPGSYGADSPESLRAQIDRLRELSDLEPPLYVEIMFPQPVPGVSS